MLLSLCLLFRLSSSGCPSTDTDGKYIIDTTMDRGTNEYLYFGCSDTLSEVTFKFGTNKVIPYCCLNNIEITSLEIPTDVSSIGRNAFYSCTINSLSFGSESKLTTLGEGAFESCTFDSIALDKAIRLTEIGNMAFQNANFKYNSLYLPGTVDTIRSKAFYQASNLNGIFLHIGGELKSVGDYAFNGNTLGLYKVDSSSSKTPLSTSHDNPIKFSQNVNTVGSYAFGDCSNYNGGSETKLYLQFQSMDSIKTIGDNPYDDHIVDFPPIISFPDDLVQIGDNAFYRQIIKVSGSDIYQFSQITSVTFPNDKVIDKIGDNAFKNQDALTIANKVARTGTLKVHSVGSYAFYLCKKINTNIQITVDGTDNDYPGTIGEYAFYGIADWTGTFTIEPPEQHQNGKYDYPQISGNAFENSGINNINFDQLESIGASAFKNCVNLQNVNSNSNPARTLKCKTISSYAFQDCSRLNLGTITADTIDTNAFDNCYALSASITVNKGVIGSEAFRRCGNVKLADLSSDYIEDINRYTPQTIGNNAFEKSGLTGQIIIPYFINKIGQYAFAYCSNLNGVTFQTENANTLSIEYRAFYNSKLDSNLVIPESVTSIPVLNNPPYKSEAFAYTKIKSLEIKGRRVNSQPTFIANDAFEYCTELTSLKFGTGEINYDSYSTYKFKGCQLKTLELGQMKIIPTEAFYGMKDLGKVTIPKTVTTIGNRAFAECPKLQITFEADSDLNTISQGAFYGCTALTMNRFPKGVTTIESYTFYGCTNLKSIDLPKDIQYIYDFAFYGCKELKVDLNGLHDLKQIGESAFEGSGLVCKSTEIEFLGDFQTVGRRAFAGCSGLDGKLVFSNIQSNIVINEFAFLNCKGIKELRFADVSGSSRKLTIKESAFDGCSNMKSELKLQNAVLNNAQYAFRGCNQLYGNLDLRDLDDSTTPIQISKGLFSGCSGFGGNLYLPSELTTIPEEAFYGCFGLTGQLPIQNVVTVEKLAFAGCSSVSGQLPCQKLTDIGESAFSGCSKLQTLPTFAKVTKMGKNAFSGCSGLSGTLDLRNIGSGVLVEYAFANCAGFNGNLILSSSISNIPSHAFYGCTGFTGTLDARGLTSIGPYAFTNCTGFTALQLGEGLTTIDKYAFNGCTGFTGSLELPESLTKIGEYAFTGCTGFNGGLHFFEKLTKIGEYAFSGCTGFSGHLSFLVKKLNIEQRAFQGCTGFKDGRLTITIHEQEEASKNTHYKYDYFLKIGNEAFDETEFEDVYYIGRFDPDCDFETGLENGIHASTNYVNKTFCHKKVKGKGGLSGGAIAGIVIACVVVVAAIVFVVVFFLCIKGKGGSRSEDEVEMNQNP